MRSCAADRLSLSVGGRVRKERREHRDEAPARIPTRLTQRPRRHFPDTQFRGYWKNLRNRFAVFPLALFPLALFPPPRAGDMKCAWLCSRSFDRSLSVASAFFVSSFIDCVVMSSNPAILFQINNPPSAPISSAQSYFPNEKTWSAL